MNEQCIFSKRQQRNMLRQLIHVTEVNDWPLLIAIRSDSVFTFLFSVLCLLIVLYHVFSTHLNLAKCGWISDIKVSLLSSFPIGKEIASVLITNMLITAHSSLHDVRSTISFCVCWITFFYVERNSTLCNLSTIIKRWL